MGQRLEPLDLHWSSDAQTRLRRKRLRSDLFPFLLRLIQKLFNLLFAHSNAGATMMTEESVPNQCINRRDRAIKESRDCLDP